MIWDQENDILDAKFSPFIQGVIQDKPFSLHKLGAFGYSRLVYLTLFLGDIVLLGRVGNILRCHWRSDRILMPAMDAAS